MKTQSESSSPAASAAPAPAPASPAPAPSAPAAASPGLAPSAARSAAPDPDAALIAKKVQAGLTADQAHLVIATQRAFDAGKLQTKSRMTSTP